MLIDTEKKKVLHCNNHAHLQVRPSPLTQPPFAGEPSGDVVCSGQLRADRGRGHTRELHKRRLVQRRGDVARALRGLRIPGEIKICH